MSLEDDFWEALKQIAARNRVTLSDLVGSIDSQRRHNNLSSSLRLFVLNDYRQRIEADEDTPPGVWRATGEAQPDKAH